MAVSIIAAVAENGAIGRGNSLLWHLREDMAFFKATTTGHPVIMGRKTWESIGRPLPKRLNIIVSRTEQPLPEGVISTHSLEEALSVAAGGDSEIFVIGGGQLYSAAMDFADYLYITKVFDSPADADTFFPEIKAEVWQLAECSETKKAEPDGVEFRFEKYIRK